MNTSITKPLATVEEQISLSSTALVVVDMQNDFCAEGGYAQTRRKHDVGFARAVAENISTLLEVARDVRLPIVWIKSIYDFKYLLPPFINKRQEEGCCLEGTWGADFFIIAPRKDETVVTKYCYNGFHDTPLDTILRSQGIQTLIFTGVATNVCVESTLRDAFFRGYYVILLSDCVGSNNKAGHAGTLTTVQTNFGHVTEARTIIECLTSAQRALGSKQLA
jgi:ureidoacrylate peracid hydrolase